MDGGFGVEKERVEVGVVDFGMVEALEDKDWAWDRSMNEEEEGDGDGRVDMVCLGVQE